jgi:small subunit ribosomal protein S1
MFEASQQAKRIEQGQTIEGTIVAIGPEVALVDVGGKSEAVIDISELKDVEGRLEVAVGDRIQATVVSTAGGLTLSRRLARGAATARQLEDAFHAGLPVEGKVELVVKGGYEVRIARQRAFCPFSQIDTARSTDPAQHEGLVYRFRIIEYRDGGKSLVVSRRALLEEEQRATAAETRRSVVAGAVITGRVTSVREFGAFVDLGSGVQGLLHVSEMGWSRVSDTSQVVKPGDEITVKVLRVDDDKQKISLGLKQLTEDPWSQIDSTYEAGQVRTGRVTRVAEFGAFVELEPGVGGLIPLSETGLARNASVKKAFPSGGEVEVVVLDVDAAARWPKPPPAGDPACAPARALRPRPRPAIRHRQLRGDCGTRLDGVSAGGDAWLDNPSEFGRNPVFAFPGNVAPHDGARTPHGAVDTEVRVGRGCGHGQ